MKRMLILLALAALIVGCGDDNPADTTEPGYGRLTIEMFDAPPPDGIEQILLAVTEIRVNRDDESWETVREADTVIDVLELTNGNTVMLVDDSLLEGHYNQIRLLLADSCKIVVDSVMHDLTVPSGTTSGFKINMDFDISEGELIEIYLDFDAAKSVVVANGSFKLKPTVHACKKALSASVAGTVTDTSGAFVENAAVEAATATDTTTTYTDSTGGYKLILPFGVYTISASAVGYTATDTTYTDVVLDAYNFELTGYDFILE